MSSTEEEEILLPWKKAVRIHPLRENYTYYYYYASPMYSFIFHPISPHLIRSRWIGSQIFESNLITASQVIRRCKPPR